MYLALHQACPVLPANVENFEDPNYPCRSFFVKISRTTSDADELSLDRILRGMSFVGQALLLVYLRDVQRKLAMYHE